MTNVVRDSSTRLVRSAVSTASIPFWTGGALLATLLVVTVAVGGLNRAEPSPRQLAVGEELRLPLYAITALDARLADEVEEEFVTADDGETLVIVTLRLENLAPYPIGVGRSADRVQSRLFSVSEPLIALSGLEPTSSTYAWRIDGSAGGVVLQPRVPTDVQLVWPVPTDAVADGAVTLDVFDGDETRGQVILSSDHITWRRSDLAAQIPLDVMENL